jgi:hypothetical protein
MTRSTIAGLAGLLVLGCETDGPAAPPVSADDTAEAAPTFDRAAACGECHPVQYGEWRQSMHAYAALSPVFDAMAAKTYRDTAGEVGVFCTRCHTPIGTLAGEPGSTTWETRSEQSREGVTCEVCHTATGHDGPVGNANLVLSPGDMKQGPSPGGDYSQHSTMQSELLTSPKLCGTCHDVFMFPGLRVEQAYSEYIESPAAEAGIRCQDCHMGPEPGAAVAREEGPIAVVNGEPVGWGPHAVHRFVGPDQSIRADFPFPDSPEAGVAARADGLVQTQTLLENAAQLTGFAAELHDGELGIDVGIENTHDGHRFPTGFTSERQAWLHVTVVDAAGVLFLESGDLDDYGDLRDEHSQAVHQGEAPLDGSLLNLQSINLVVHREFNEDGTFQGDLSHPEDPPGEFTTVFPFDASTIVRQSIEPGEVRLGKYRTRLPQVVWPVTITVALRYRALPAYTLRALQMDEVVAMVPVFTLDEQTLVLEAP